MSATAQAALVYPAVLGVMALLMMSALMVFVVPKLVEQFAMLGTTELPMLTELVIGASGFVRQWGVAVLALTGMVIFLFLRALKSHAVKRRWDRFVLTLPFVGPLLRTLAAARFARVHATLASSGATVLEALTAAGNAMGNLVFREAALSVRERVQQGGSLSSAMKATGVFPPLLTHMVQSGEAARDVPTMMNRGAEFLKASLKRPRGQRSAFWSQLSSLFLAVWWALSCCQSCCRSCSSIRSLLDEGGRHDAVPPARTQVRTAVRLLAR